MGLFSSFVPAGVYTQTEIQSVPSQLSGTPDIPVFIGTGTETLTRKHLEMVRGSSSIADTQITREDQSAQWVLDETDPSNIELGENDGTYRKFRVLHYPIVDGSGNGTVTTNVSKVTVLVDGEIAIVSAISGATGMVTLQTAPDVGATVTCTYFFRRTDTQITDDVSDQADGSSKLFKAFNTPIVDGSDGGITSTNVEDVTVKVNGEAVTVVSLSGSTGEVVLATAPSDGSVVTIEYYFNTWQNTFDYLPDSSISEMVSAGITPGDNSYVEGVNYVIKDGLIFWGASYFISSGIHTSGSETFDDTQITATLVDNKVWLNECSSYTDPATSTVSNTTVRLTYVPTLGNGRDTTLSSTVFENISNGRIDVATDRPDLIEAYVGVDVVDALSRPSVEILTVDGLNRLITLGTALRPNEKVYANYHHNILADDTYTVIVLTAGESGVGTYEILSDVYGQNLHSVTLVSKTAISQELNWDTGAQNLIGAYHDGSGVPIEEYVKLTLNTEAARSATLKSSVEGPWLITTSNNKFKVGSTTVTLTSSTGATLSGDTFETYATQAAVTATAPDGDFDVNGLTLKITVDGGSIQTVTFTADNQSISNIVTKVNSDTTGLVASNSGNNLILTSDSYGENSSILIGNGTSNTELGFSTSQTDTGSESYDLDGLSFVFDINGTEYTVDFTSDNMTVEDIGDAISAVCSEVTCSNTNGGLTITTTSLGDDVALTIGSGTANTILGFASSDTDNGANTPVATVASDLDAGLNAINIACTVSGNHIVLSTDSTGSSTSITIATVSNNCYDTLGFETGQSDQGEDAYQAYSIESYSDSGFTISTTNGSGTGDTGTGYVGQTFVDDVTGLTFTLLAPSGGSLYDDEGIIKLKISPTFTATAGTTIYAIPGLELVVSNTTDTAVGDTATVETFDKGGDEPAVGDYYYLTYKYNKEAVDYEAKVFTNMTDVINAYGPVSPENSLSLAMYLANLNGAQVMAAKQVPVASGGVDASTQDYMDAIDSLKNPLPGELLPGLIIPVTTNQTVINYVKTHCAIQSSPRYRQERISIFGFAAGTKPEAAQAYATSLRSNRMIGVYPDILTVSLKDSYGAETDYVVNGSFAAAALAGHLVSPARDPATPITNKNLVGFKKMNRTLDEITRNRCLQSGLTVLKQNSSNIKIIQGFTTDMSNVLTREPTVILIIDHVQRTARSISEGGVGVKFLGSALSDIERALKVMFSGLKSRGIVANYRGIRVYVDPTDPTTALVEAEYAPILPLNYIHMKFSVALS